MPPYLQLELTDLKLLDELDDAILLIDKQDGILEVNKTACTLYGYSKQQLCQMQLKDLLAPNIAQLSPTSPFVNQTPTTWHCDKDGSPLYVELLVRPLNSTAASNAAALVRIRNISLAFQNEQQHQRDYQIYKAVIESGPVLIARVLPDTTITFSNDRFCTYFGHKRSDIIGKRMMDFPPDEETRNFLRDYFVSYAQNPRVIIHDNIVIDGNGQSRWVQFTESPIFDTRGNLCEVQIVAIDIHEQKLAELKTQQNEAKYRALMEQSNEGILLLEMKSGKILEVNRKICEIFGYSPDELLSLKHRQITTETEDCIKKAETELYQNSSLPLENIQIIAKRGLLIEVERLAKRLTLDGKDIALISLRDVSEKRTIEKALQEQAEELKNRINQLKKSWAQTIDVLAAASEAKDPYTAGHQKRVAQLAVAIGRELKLPEEQITALRMAALIHDIGKITVPAELLSKPGALTQLEYMLVQVHVAAGYELLHNLELPWNVADVVHQHHERFDGSGYPNKLAKDKMLFKASILGVADVVEAMSSHRPYRPALGPEFALLEIEKGRGTQFDPDVVDACLKLFREKDFCFDEANQSVPMWHIANRKFKE